MSLQLEDTTDGRFMHIMYEKDKKVLVKTIQYDANSPYPSRLEIVDDIFKSMFNLIRLSEKD